MSFVVHRNFINSSSRIENKQVMIDIMLQDKQIHDLKENYKLIRNLREGSNNFNQIVDYIKSNF